jgi:hypothetical protein
MGRRCVADASPFHFIASQFGCVRFGAALSGSADLGQPASLADPAWLERRAGAGRCLAPHAAGYVIPPGVFPTETSARALAILLIRPLHSRLNVTTMPIAGSWAASRRRVFDRAQGDMGQPDAADACLGRDDQGPASGQSGVISSPGFLATVSNFGAVDGMAQSEVR